MRNNRRIQVPRSSVAQTSRVTGVTSCVPAGDKHGKREDDEAEAHTHRLCELYTDSVTKAKLVVGTHLYYDMSYSVAYSTFANIPSDTTENSGISTDADSENGVPVKTTSLLELYSGCGGMSTGLIENDLFKQDWQGRGHILRYFALKWALCFLDDALTAAATFVANLGVENVVGAKFVITSKRMFARR
ncbi:hypothetical protein ZWY2020_022967 [Hordeum vulgare]|nr:hypothetical protein ZWY2020_022967 [Hordeum vulgare]